MPNCADTSGDFLWRKVEATRGARNKQDALMRNLCLAQRDSRAIRTERLSRRTTVKFPARGHGSSYCPQSPAASSWAGALKTEFEMANSDGRGCQDRAGTEGVCCGTGQMWSP